jgi:excisionase family DNA binding protein
MYQREDADLGPLPDGTPATLPTLLLTYDETAAHLRVSRRQVELMVERDELPHMRVGKLRRIAYEDIRAWIKRQRKFHSYYITPDTLRLMKKQTDDRRLSDEFGWD